MAVPIILFCLFVAWGVHLWQLVDPRTWQTSILRHDESMTFHCLQPSVLGKWHTYSLTLPHSLRACTVVAPGYCRYT
jgi:hypothetical protein